MIHKPRGKDVDKQTIADLRRMLTEAGLNPDGSPAVADERERDHRDNRWGKPTE